MRKIRFEKLKQIAEENVSSIARQLLGKGSWWHLEAKACLVSVRDYLRDGTVTGTRNQMKNIECALRDTIRSFDVRMIGDLVQILKQGYHGVPAWVLNSPIEVSLEDEGWMVRSAA